MLIYDLIRIHITDIELSNIIDDPFDPFVNPLTHYYGRGTFTSPEMERNERLLGVSGSVKSGPNGITSNSAQSRDFDLP